MEAIPPGTWRHPDVKETISHCRRPRLSYTGSGLNSILIDRTRPSVIDVLVLVIALIDVSGPRTGP
jgi:hypothetical protein